MNEKLSCWGKIKEDRHVFGAEKQYCTEEQTVPTSAPPPPPPQCTSLPPAANHFHLWKRKRVLRFLLNKFRPPSNQQFLPCNIMASSLPHPLPLLFCNPNNYIHLVYETTLLNFNLYSWSKPIVGFAS